MTAPYETFLRNTPPRESNRFPTGPFRLPPSEKRNRPLRRRVLLLFGLCAIVGLPVSGLCLEIGQSSVSRDSARSISFQAIAPETRAEVGFDPAESGGIFVGVNEFDDPALAPLNFAVDDAVDLAHRLVELGLIAAPKIVLALAGEPTKAESKARLAALVSDGATRTRATLGNVVDALDRVPRATGAKGMLFVHLCSHGFDHGDVGVIAFADTRRSNLGRTAMPIPEISEAIRGTARNPTRATRRLVLVDACREKALRPEGAARGMGRPAPATRHFLDAFEASGGQAVVHAADVGRFSYEDPDLGQGIFTHYVLAGLGGAAPVDPDGVLRLKGLIDWVGERVEEATRTKFDPQIIAPNVPPDAGRIPLAVDPKARATALGRHARFQKGLELLAVASISDRLTIPATLVADVETAAERLTPGELDRLGEELEFLTENTPRNRRNFAWFWRETHAKRIATPAPPAASPVAPTPAITAAPTSTPPVSDSPSRSDAPPATESAAAPRPIPADPARFRLAPEGVILDTKTGLEWVVGPDRDTTHREAEEWARALTVGGAGWRMPTRAELRPLFHRGAGPRNIDPVFAHTGWWIWAEPQRSGVSWRVHFDLGEESPYRNSFNPHHRAFAVRAPRR